MTIITITNITILLLLIVIMAHLVVGESCRDAIFYRYLPGVKFSVSVKTQTTRRYRVTVHHSSQLMKTS